MKWRFDGRGTAYLLGTFTLEAVGVASGAYAYGDFPFKLFGVPLYIPFMWLFSAYFAYLMFESYGAIGVFLAYLVDLVLEPIAYYFDLWHWVSPYSVLVIPFGTLANACVWILMLTLGVLLFRHGKGGS